MKEAIKWKDIPKDIRVHMQNWINVCIKDEDGNTYRDHCGNYFHPTEAISSKSAKVSYGKDVVDELIWMYNNGRFQVNECPECFDMVYFGEPRNWNNFQGVHNKDVNTYFGNSEKYTQEYLEQMCDRCRRFS